MNNCDRKLKHCRGACNKTCGMFVHEEKAHENDKNTQVQSACRGQCNERTAEPCQCYMRAVGETSPLIDEATTQCTRLENEIGWVIQKTRKQSHFRSDSARRENSILRAALERAHTASLGVMPQSTTLHTPESDRAAELRTLNVAIREKAIECE